MKKPSIALALVAFALAIPASSAAEPSTYTRPIVLASYVSSLRLHVNATLRRKCRPQWPLGPPAGRIRPERRVAVVLLWVGRHRAAHAVRDRCALIWRWRDHDLVAATTFAGGLFGISSHWLTDCRNAEGGDVGRENLRRTLLSGHQPGWNKSGSYAFGPWQFMLGSKPAPRPWQWGTFGANAPEAWRQASHRGARVPLGFRRPDSYVGQALVAAWMFRAGQSGQWTGAGC